MRVHERIEVEALYLSKYERIEVEALYEASKDIFISPG